MKRVILGLVILLALGLEASASGSKNKGCTSKSKCKGGKGKYIYKYYKWGSKGCKYGSKSWKYYCKFGSKWKGGNYCPGYKPSGCANCLPYHPIQHSIFNWVNGYMNNERGDCCANYDPCSHRGCMIDWVLSKQKKSYYSKYGKYGSGKFCIKAGSKRYTNGCDGLGYDEQLTCVNAWILQQMQATGFDGLGGLPPADPLPTDVLPPPEPLPVDVPVPTDLPPLDPVIVDIPLDNSNLPVLDSPCGPDGCGTVVGDTCANWPPEAQQYCINLWADQQSCPGGGSCSCFGRPWEAQSCINTRLLGNPGCAGSCGGMPDDGKQGCINRWAIRQQSRNRYKSPCRCSGIKGSKYRKYCLNSCAIGRQIESRGGLVGGTCGARYGRGNYGRVDNCCNAWFDRNPFGYGKYSYKYCR